MADGEATVLLKVKADSSQAVRETDKLTDAQKKLVQAVEASASKFDKMVSAGRGAFSGLGNTMQGLNQGLEVIDKVIKTVDKAVDSQLVEKAKSFGLQVKNAADATNQLHAALLKQPNALDDTTRSLLKTRDAMDDLGKYTQQVVAEVVVPLVNIVVDRVRDLIEYGSDFIDLLSHGGVTRLRVAQDAQRTSEVRAQGQNFYGDILAAGGANANYGANSPLGIDQRARAVGGSYLNNEDYAAALYGDIGGTVGTGKISPRGASKANAIPVRIVDIDPTAGGRAGGVVIPGAEGLSGGYYAGNNGYRPGGVVGSADGLSFSGTGMHGLGGLAGHGESFAGNKDLAAMSDPLAKLKGQLGDTTTAAGAAYATLAGGITAAVDAAITGSDSIGKAAAKASAAVLKSISIEATGRAVYEGALAVGSLAISDFKGAATHGLAAAKFAAAAAVTGALSAGLGSAASGGGGGGGSAAAGAPAGGFGQATGGSSGGGPLNITINVGAGFEGDAKKLATTLAREIRKAELGGRVRGGGYATEVSG